MSRRLICASIKAYLPGTLRLQQVPARNILIGALHIIPGRLYVAYSRDEDGRGASLAAAGINGFKFEFEFNSKFSGSAFTRTASQPA
jgi:hypothetical protein